MRLCSVLMSSIYKHILEARKLNKKLLAVLLDPDKTSVEIIGQTIQRINNSEVDMILIGGSEVEKNRTDEVISVLRPLTKLPLILFPGHPDQLSDQADGLLFLSLLSGRNPEYLVEKQLEAVPFIESAHLEVIPTAYILIENGSPSSVERISKTTPIGRDRTDLISQTAKAGEYLGMKLVYLEAGSGARQRVPDKVIKAVRERISIPLIVGGGIRSRQEMDQVFKAGADMVVVGTALEKDPEFLSAL